MHDYFYLIFPRQLRMLQYEKPPGHVNEIFHLDNALFFGGEDWERVQADLSVVPNSDRERFILSLFMIIVTDQALYTYNAATYENWKAATRYPKFGWFGFGTHNVNPLKLLWVPEERELIDTEAIIAAIPKFVDFFVTETERVVVGHGYTPSLDIHFVNMRHDPAWSFNKGKIIPALKAALDARLPP